jgi:hypothetical protein
VKRRGAKQASKDGQDRTAGIGEVMARRGNEGKKDKLGAPRWLLYLLLDMSPRSRGGCFISSLTPHHVVNPAPIQARGPEAAAARGCRCQQAPTVEVDPPIDVCGASADARRAHSHYICPCLCGSRPTALPFVQCPLVLKSPWHPAHKQYGSSPLCPPDRGRARRTRSHRLPRQRL